MLRLAKNCPNTVKVLCQILNSDDQLPKVAMATEYLHSYTSIYDFAYVLHREPERYNLKKLGKYFVARKICAAV